MRKVDGKEEFNKDGVQSDICVCECEFTKSGLCRGIMPSQEIRAWSGLEPLMLSEAVTW